MHKRKSKGRCPRGDGSRGPRSSGSPAGRAWRPPSIALNGWSGVSCALESSRAAAVWTTPRCLKAVVAGIILAALCALVLLAIPVAAGHRGSSALWSFASKCCRGRPFRSLFVIFLLAGVNLEANIGITPEQEKVAKVRAAEIAAMAANQYEELASQNKAALNSLPIVSACQMSQVASKLNNSFVRVTLNCTEECGGERQPQLRCSAKCPSVAQAAEILLEYLLKHHATCLQRGAASRCVGCCQSCELGSCSSAAPATVNAFERMKETQRRSAELKAARIRLDAAESEHEKAEKRMRPNPSATEAKPKATSIPYYDRYKNWDLSQFMTRMGESMRRRNTLMCSETVRHEPRADGNEERDAMLHWRKGLVGAVQDWADGSLQNGVILIVRLVSHFNAIHPGFQDQVISKLTGGGLTEQAVLHAQMISTAREAINELKIRGDTESVRREYLAALALFAPDEQCGNEYAVARELGVKTGERKSRGGAAGKKRPRAFRRAMQIRERFRAAVRRASEPFKDGDSVLCRGEQAVLAAIRDDGSCTVSFGSGTSEKCVEYASMVREPAGSGRKEAIPCARLQHIPPSLSPSAREKRSDALSDEVKKSVQDSYESNCATSPHQRDSVKRRLSRYVIEKAQALIMTSTFKELYEAFRTAHANVKLSYAMFKRLAPWNLKRAYRETCVCRCCELFRLYVEGLHTVADLLGPLVPSEEEDDNAAEAEEDRDGDTAEPGQPDSRRDQRLTTLIAFCRHQRKSAMVNDLVCGRNLEMAKQHCISGQCASCGFKCLWSGQGGLRSTLVDSYGKLKPGVAPQWQTVMKWETLKSGKQTPSDGSSDERDGLRERREGTPIQFLDEFEKESAKFPSHKFLVGEVKRGANQRDQSIWPGMLVANYDWSENGTILNAIQIQSEYWSLVHYSLFICITGFLRNEAWRSRTSYLPKGSEVTVELEGESIPDSLEPCPGAYFAVVDRCPSNDGGSVEGCESDVYWVKAEGQPEAVAVPRERLRHRKMHTTAFVCITDEKRHDAVTTQHFLDLQLAYWREHQDSDNPFWAWVGHSDNASHFKSGAMLNYWSRKRTENDSGLTSIWIEFGCPGHGKGPWDGMGAVVKQQLTRDLTSQKILTESGYVTRPSEAAEHLRRRFETPEWRETHKSKPINEIKLFYSHHDEIIRPLVEHEYDSLDGKMSTYSYMVLAADQIAGRGRSCWCEPCCRARGRSNMRVDRGVLRAEGCTANGWVEQTVKDKGTGLAGRRREAQARGKELALRLKAARPGDHAAGFMAIQARESWSQSDDTLYRPGHYWIAQAPDVLDVRKIDTRCSIEGTMFSPGDYLVRIGRYFDRKASDASGLTFEEWMPPTNAAHSGSFIINATELRAVNFSMLPTNPSPPLVEVRRCSRLAGRVVSVPPPTPPREYTIPQLIDDEIRAACW